MILKALCYVVGAVALGACLAGWLFVVAVFCA